MLPGADRIWSDLDPAIAHCNHGSYGAVARSVREHQDALRRRADANTNRWFRFELPDRVEAARRFMAGFVGAAEGRAAWVANATTAINIALAAVPLGRGDEVLLTDHSFGAVRITADRFAERSGAAVVTAGVELTADADAVVSAVLSAVTDRTRVAIVEHIASPTGLVFPVPAIVAALRERGVVTVVDAAHAPGSVALAVDELGADFWAGNFHKWCATPRPCAALVVSDQWRDRTEPLVASFGLDQGYPTSFAWRGTDDYTALLCLEPATEIFASFGWADVWNHNRALASWGAGLVAEAIGAEPALPDGAHVGMSLVPLPAGAATTATTARELVRTISTDLAVEVVTNPWRGRGWLRLSAQVYNREADYERLAAGLPDVLSRLGQV